MDNNSKKLELTITYDIYPDETGLSEDERSLVSDATKALATSYSPYSHFRVGAAVALADGSIVTGSNQENASYGMTSCAERSALFAIGSQGKGKMIRKIAVICRPDGYENQIDPQGSEVMGTPCGACRQVIKEFEDLSGGKIIILNVMNSGRVFRFEGINSLLPFGFGPASL